MTTVAERLIAIRKMLNMTQVEMARFVGISANTWRRCEQQNEPPSSEVLTRLIEEGFNANWLLADIGTMSISEACTASQATNSPDEKRAWLKAEVARMGYVDVPRYDVEAAAGAGAVIDGEQSVRTIGFQREWLHRELGANPANLVVLQARGDSMLGRIHDGDILLVDTSEPKLRSGRQVYAFTHEGLLYVKYIEAKLDGGLIVSSDNGDVYPPQQISREDAQNVKIIGRVLWNAGKI